MSEPVTPSVQHPTASPHDPVAPAARAAGRNSLAVAAVLLGVAAIVVSAFGQFVPLAMLSAGDLAAMQLYGFITAVVSLITLLLALAALICGLVAAQRPVGRLAAGIAVGIGIAEIVAVLAGFAYGGLASLL